MIKRGLIREEKIRQGAGNIGKGEDGAVKEKQNQQRNRKIG